MKKLFGFSLILCLLVVFGIGTSFATAPATENVWDIFQGGGSAGITPTTVVIKVRYAGGASAAEANWASISSGDVLIWDTNSADGITISGCILLNDGKYAGVAVTDILTADLGNTNKGGWNRNWGWMAVKGYCLAKVDTSQASTGQKLVTNGVIYPKSFGAGPEASLVGAAVSSDIGLLLRDDAADGLMPVWLK